MCAACPSGKRQSRKWQHCKRCNRSRAEAGPLSLRGYCIECAVLAASTQQRDLHYRRGQAYENWKRGLQAFVTRLTAE